MISRRRFLSISASMALSSALPAAAAQAWRGNAFGAKVSIELTGNKLATQPALAAALDTIRRMEKFFSLYDPASALSALNRTSSLKMPPEFARLVGICDEIHRLTDGLFDPTVQPLFAAMLQSGGELSEAERQHFRPIVGWENISRVGSEIRFAQPGMALTFNGIAQGFATDRVTDVLAAHGFENAVVNIGEYRVGNDPASITIENSNGKELARPKLTNRAIATTSATGYLFADGAGHILRPDLRDGKIRWKTVSVTAETAAMADGLSTALALTQGDAMARSLHERGCIQAALLEDLSGNVIEVRPL
ncbi:MAG: FAD:protein FMN transferase [Rhizobiaceae bacterium]